MIVSMLRKNQFIFEKSLDVNILSPGPILNSNFPVLTVVAISVFNGIH
jgi:hypothetical protein